MSILPNTDIKFSNAGLFSTDDVWIHPERTERTYEIICVTRGRVCIEENGRIFDAGRGQVMILSPNIPHKGVIQTHDVAFYWLHFRLGESSLPFEKRFFDSFESMYLFKEILHYSNLPSTPDYMTNAVLLHIIAELRWLSDGKTNETSSTAEKIYEWIRINADGTLTVERVAEHFGYSTDHITRICKRNFGTGGRELINRFVIARAKELLCNTDKYIKEIAAELEFKDDKTFIRYFKYHEGCFPTQFRNRFVKIKMNKK